MTTYVRRLRKVFALVSSILDVSSAGAVVELANTTGAAAQAAAPPLMTADQSVVPEATVISRSPPQGKTSSARVQSWLDSVKLGVQFEGGIAVNPTDPSNRLNFGHLFTDQSNRPVLDEAQVTLQRVINPSATDYQFGFSLQADFGTDARYLHYIGEFDKATKSLYQIAVDQAFVSAHLPWLTSEGLDIKVGQYPSPLGFEQIDPSQSPFYSHSYISNFGVPAEHTGLLGALHANQWLDFWLGIDSGSSTSLGSGDNNSSPAGIFGLGLNGFLDGKLTVLALTHIGPEIPSRLSRRLSKEDRYYNDIVFTYKASSKLTITTEVNFVRDEGLSANAYGVAQYLSYNFSKLLSVSVRGEIFRDERGLFAVTFPDRLGFANALRGDLSGTAFAPPNTTFSEWTAGLIWSPPVSTPPNLLKIRPELRYDHALTSARPFNTGRDRDAFTSAVDIVLAFF